MGAKNIPRFRARSTDRVRAKRANGHRIQPAAYALFGIGVDGLIAIL
jgi:hypothetical protein